MNITGFTLGLLLARQNNVPSPQALAVALPPAIMKSPAIGLLIASTVARNLRPPPPPPPQAPPVPLEGVSISTDVTTGKRR
jgi:hypothetical protein